MSSVNGTTIFSAGATSITPSATKRKREGSENPPHVNGLARSKSEQHGQSQIQRVLADTFEILKTRDTTPSLLQLPLPPSTPRARSEPSSAKRAKLAEAPSESILAKVNNQAYSSLKELSQDIDIAAEELLAPIEAKLAYNLNGSQSRSAQITREEKDLMTRVLALQKLVKTIVGRETCRAAPHHNGANGVDEDVAHDETNVPNGIITIKAEGDDADPFEKGRTVLTLYGNAQ
ncbi:hypothetical protein LTS18_014254, partial [Coniosporium uncinatum]